MLTESSPRGTGRLLSSSTSLLESHGGKDGETAWTTKKKVEVVTTKNIERTIQRQVVLEDGRVLDEEIPVVTVDTIENKEIFETDHDEEQDNDYNDRRRGVDVGDRVTTFKTTKDLTENVTKTEASHNIGLIANRDIPIVMKDKKSLKNLMRKEERGSAVSVAPPRVVHSTRSHRTVTDTERLQERNIRRGDKILLEKIKTEEHEVYNSADSETSDDEADFEKIEYEELKKEQPLEYKTRTEESFIEYFQKGEPGMVRVGEGPRYKTETKQYNKNHLTSLNKTQSPRRQLKQSRSWDNDTNNKLQAIQKKPLSSNYSSSLNDLSRNSEERVFIAKVIEETPTVRLRNKKKQDLSKYMEHRQSANFSSSGEAMRNSSSRSYLYPNCRVIKQQRPVSLDITDKFYFSDCGKQRREERNSSSSTLRQEKKYHSSLDISEKPKQIEIKIERPQRSHYSLVPSLSTDRQVCTRSLVKKGEKFQSVGDICFTSSKEIPQTRPSKTDRQMSGQLIFTTEKQPFGRAVEKSWKTSSCTNLSTRVIPIEVSSSCLSSPGSPATKYKTRVAVHNHGSA